MEQLRGPLDGRGEVVADGVEGGGNLGGEAAHGADYGEAYERGHEGVLDEILTGLIRK